MKTLIFSFFFLLVSSLSYGLPADWGKTGHRATGAIAQKYLSKKAKREIEKLLDGQSLALVSTFADEIKSDDNYREYAPWHYVNFPFDSNYDIHPKSDKGDLYMAIQKCMEVLKDDNATKEKKAFHLKLLVHFLGDLHQPLHVGMAEDRGGNRFQVQWFDEGTNLHSVWDEKIIESYQMSYTELAKNSKKLSKNELQNIQNGSVKDWMYESRGLCEQIYKTTISGDNLGYLYMYDYVDVVRSQLQKGGIRLAVLLNDIFK
ncbi:S1/P1 nuclease [Ulvibacter sp. MAR_2010_11]|uniref:S1/P1 nuclease n=1 Tax=Ulvibacter sp. MAR_2010_11 TaxID=1250229 RepID=UPI000C2BF88A|nr:S1/P1 nuclease [Ulvibacter sp. MAR_2010_11]PKA83684.1 S1/P1 nuclease [Ulvibacter sp. MAR_2010_11]